MTLVLLAAAQRIAADTCSSLDGKTTAAGTGATREFHASVSVGQEALVGRETLMFAEERHSVRVLRLDRNQSGGDVGLAFTRLPVIPRRGKRNPLETILRNTESSGLQ